jgi:glyoxylase-like metal-dependent hydrolase (beta-lactamase superfamily II)
LRLQAVCLTHGHSDHAGKLQQVLARWPVPVYLGQEDLDLAPWLPTKQLLQTPVDGQTVNAGQLTVNFMVTPGHTPGGICYRVASAGADLCFVGDTLFAGSIGRANPFSLYPRHLLSVRNRVLTLPQRTVLFPGHGPATTVAEELQRNPFAG